MTPSLLEVRASSADQRACCSSFPRTLRVIPAHAGDPVHTEGAVVTGSPAFAGDDGRSISPCASSPRTRGSSRHRERGGYWVARSSLHSGPPKAGPRCRAMTTEAYPLARHPRARGDPVNTEGAVVTGFPLSRE
jgi:hypothetical protein